MRIEFLDKYEDTLGEKVYHHSELPPTAKECLFMAQDYIGGLMHKPDRPPKAWTSVVITLLKEGK